MLTDLIRERVLTLAAESPVTSVAYLRARLDDVCPTLLDAVLLDLIDSRTLAGYCDRVPSTLLPHEHVEGIVSVGRMDW